MYKWLINKKKRMSDMERYIVMIMCMIIDIKNIEYLKQIFELAEILWHKEKREKEGETAELKAVNPVSVKN